MSKSHSKKRNSALMYEFLVRSISTALVENNNDRSSTALKVLKKHFKPGTELYKEFRLASSLVKTTVSSESVAASIIREAKEAARSHDVAKLDREKSLLIRNVNHKLNDSLFYDQPIKEYRMYATIQTLFNDWRSRSANLERIARYEDQLTKWLVTEKDQIEDSPLLEGSTGSNRLLMKIMMQKLNEKYADVLNESQRSIIRSYAWSTTQDDDSSIKNTLDRVRGELVESIDNYVAGSENEYVNNKLNETKEKLVSESLDSVDDSMITRFMLYVKLNDELTAEDSQ